MVYENSWSSSHFSPLPGRHTRGRESHRRGRSVVCAYCGMSPALLQTFDYYSIEEPHGRFLLAPRRPSRLGRIATVGIQLNQLLLDCFCRLLSVGIRKEANFERSFVACHEPRLMRQIRLSAIPKKAAGDSGRLVGRKTATRSVRAQVVGRWYFLPSEEMGR